MPTVLQEACCWQATQPATAYPSLSGRHEVEVAIVGAGIAGLSAALPLTRAGRRVAVIEAGRVGRQVTGRSTGKITTQHALLYDHLIETLGRHQASLYAEANKDGMQQIFRWIEENDIPCMLEQKEAYTYLGPEREGLDAMSREVEAAKSLGLPADFLERAPLPFAAGGAVRFTEQAQFNPGSYLVGLARAVAGAGGEVFENSRVTAVDDAGRWSVKTAEGEVVADSVFLATALPIAGPEDFSHRTQPRYHVMMAFRLAPEDAPDGMFISAEAAEHSFRTGYDNEGPLLIVLGPHFSTGQEADIEAHYRGLEQWTRARFKVGDAAWRWVNEDYDTAARVPFVGQADKSTEGLYVATGFNAWGISNGAAGGLLVADMVLGRDCPWAEVYATDRKSPKGFHSSGKTQSRVESLEAIPAGGGGVLQVGDDELAIWRDHDGTPHAVAAECTHKGCPVTWNNAERTWDCPCHGSIFACDGSVLHGPAVKPLAPRDVPD